MKKPRKVPKIRKAPAKRVPNVTPQAQAMYDRVMLAARRVIFGDPNDDSRFKIVLQRLAGGKAELGLTIGQITATVIANVQGAIEKAGKQVSGGILFHAGREIIADLVDIACAYGLMTRAQTQAITKQAVDTAVATYKQAQAAMSAAQPQAAPLAPPMQPPPAQPGIVNAARGV